MASGEWRVASGELIAGAAREVDGLSLGTCAYELVGGSLT